MAYILLPNIDRFKNHSKCHIQICLNSFNTVIGRSIQCFELLWLERWGLVRVSSKSNSQFQTFLRPAESHKKGLSKFVKHKHQSGFISKANIDTITYYIHEAKTFFASSWLGSHFSPQTKLDQGHLGNLFYSFISPLGPLGPRVLWWENHRSGSFGQLRVTLSSIRIWCF